MRAEAFRQALDGECSRFEAESLDMRSPDKAFKGNQCHFLLKLVQKRK